MNRIRPFKQASIDIKLKPSDIEPAWKCENKMIMSIEITAESVEENMELNLLSAMMALYLAGGYKLKAEGL